MGEKDRLEQISQNSLYASGVMPVAIRKCFDVFREHFVGSNILELGPAEGVMTELLIESGKHVSCVEGASLFCDRLNARFPGVSVFNCLFEEFQPSLPYDNIVLGHVLEHVEDPKKVLGLVKTWLRPGGRVFAAVPNSMSLHRQAAVLMKLLSAVDELNSLDIHHGHRRVFNPETLKGLFLSSGFLIEKFGGYWVKPVSNGQLEASWSAEMLEAYMELGQKYPDIAAEIYVVATLS